MATPQETRFLRLALTKKRLSRDQLKTCLQFQKEKQNQGSRIPLWDCTVLNNMLQQEEAERLQEEAGDLPVDQLAQFKLIRKLGEGGMGTVWEAAGEDGRRVAVKVLSSELAKRRPLLTRFFREAQACIKLEHDHIVRGIDVGEDEGRYFFAMEFVEGESVQDVLDRAGAMDIAACTRIIHDIADALAYAHESGIIHRDIKPDNIMLTAEGVAKLADLGLVRHTDAEMTALTRTGTGMGTPFYMAPEQSTDAKRVDGRADIYALGATWYHMVTGRVPFSGETPLEIVQKHLRQPVKSPQVLRSEVPRSVAATIQKMMGKKPEERFQSARELVGAIEEKCLGDQTILDELGIGEKKTDETLWDMKIAIGERLEKRRLSTSEVRTRIRKGQIDRETLTRRAGTRDRYQPAGAFKELEREFPRDYAVQAKPGQQKEEPRSRAALHTLVTDYDKKEKAYRRKKLLKKALPILIKLGILAAITLVVWKFWPQLQGLVGGLLGGGGEAAP